MSKLNELITAGYRTDKAADDLNSELMRDLGLEVRYGPARLAIAMSLSDKRPVYPDDIPQGDKGKEIKGAQMLGQECPGVLVALITQHAGQPLTKQEFQNALAAHWSRGVKMLRRTYVAAGRDYDKMLGELSERVSLPDDGGQPFPHTPPRKASHAKSAMPSHGPVDLHIGGLMGSKQGKVAQWRINAPPNPPHIAVMGAPNKGKTRLALGFAESIRARSGCAAFVFDMGKGDIAEDSDFCRKIGVEVIACPKVPIPLDILHVADKEDNATIQNTAARLCDSVKCVTQGAPGAVQMNRLRKVAVALIAQSEVVSIPLLRDAYREEYPTEDSISSALDSICAYNLFIPDHPPAEFFSRSWLFDLHTAADDIQRFAALMILGALDRHFKQIPDAPTDSDSNRQIMGMLVIDEARKVLGFPNSALNDIIRLSRSKGGVVILISQSPNDYQNEETNFLENIGLIASYQTNATSASVRKVFGEAYPVEKLGSGECAVRISGQSVQKVKVWG